jgi:hypothetical protein
VLELFGMSLSAGVPPQTLTFISERLFQRYFGSLGCLHYLVVHDLEQARVGVNRHRLLLHSRINDHTLKISRFDCLAAHRRIDRGLQNLLGARIANRCPKTPDLDFLLLVFAALYFAVRLIRGYGVDDFRVASHGKRVSK